MKELILHIGIAKTGTTSIQAGLAKNASQLEQAGFFYPCRSAAPYVQHAQHVPLVAGMCGHDIWWLQPHKRNTVDRALPELLIDIEASPAQTVILSSEAFSETRVITPQKVHSIRKQLENFKVRIIAYVRRQDHYLLSQYQQNIKSGSIAPLNFENFNEMRGLHFRDRLQSWREAFGKKNMTIRPFDPRFWKSNDPFLDFLETIGAPQNGVISPPATNEGLDYRAVELVRQISNTLRNRASLSPAQQHEVRQRLVRHIQTHRGILPDYQKMRLSAEQANQLRLTFREENSWCLQDTGLDVDDFFPELPSGIEQQLKPASLDTEMLLRLVTSLKSERQPDNKVEATETPPRKTEELLELIATIASDIALPSPQTTPLRSASMFPQ